MYYVVVDYAEDRSDPNYREMPKEQTSGVTGEFGLDVAADQRSIDCSDLCAYLGPCSHCCPCTGKEL